MVGGVFKRVVPREIERGARVGVARLALVVAGTTCLAVTPSFALAYFAAYGLSIGESPPPWLSGSDWLTWSLGSDPVSSYNRHGVLFGMALFVVVAALTRLVSARKNKGPRELRGCWLTVGGLGAVATGSLLEYGVPESVFDAGYGFGLELLGFLSIGIGTIVLGLAIRRESAAGRVESTAVALVGPVGVVAGTAITGHLPSGPALLLIATAIVIGVTGIPQASRP